MKKFSLLCALTLMVLLLFSACSEDPETTSFTVTYDSDGGSVVSPQTVISPATTVGTLPEAPTNDGYTFGGWFTAIDGGGTEFSADTPVTVDITVYAKWNSIFTVTYDSDGGSAVSLQTVLSPATTVATLPVAPTNTGYSFGGWFTETSGGGTEFTAATPITADITVYAKWNSIYTVTYNSDSGTSVIPQTVVFPATTVGTLPVAPTNTGYTFGGWFTETSGDGTAFNASTSVTADITVYAYWIAAGSTWTERALPGFAYWNAVAYGNGVFVAVAQTTTNAVSSPDGITWTTRILPILAEWCAVTYGDGIFVAIARTTNIAATSPDGITWTARTLPSSANWCSVTYGNGVFVAVTYNNSSIAATSPDGIIWTARTLPSSEEWYSLSFGNGVFVIAAYGSTMAATSPDGITWTTRTLPSSAGWRALTYGDGVFVVVASGSTSAATSPDGITWTARTLPGSENRYTVTYGNGIFVTVAYNSDKATTSPDGITWTERTLPSSEDWYSVTYGDGVFVAIVTGGSMVATSP